MLPEHNSEHSSNLKNVRRTQLVLNWVNFCFANIVWSIRRTVFGVEKASFNFWEYSPSSTNLVSDWLRAESSPVDEEEIKIKMDDGVATGTSLFSEGFF